MCALRITCLESSFNVVYKLPAIRVHACTRSCDRFSASKSLPPFLRFVHSFALRFLWIVFEEPNDPSFVAQFYLSFRLIGNNYYYACAYVYVYILYIEDGFWKSRVSRGIKLLILDEDIEIGSNFYRGIFFVKTKKYERGIVVCASIVSLQIRRRYKEKCYILYLV